MRWPITAFTMFDGIAKPIPMLPPVPEKIAVFTPTSSPDRFTEAAVHLPARPGRRAPRGHGEGLRVRQGAVRRLHAGGAQVAGGALHPGDRHHRVRPARPG